MFGQITGGLCRLSILLSDQSMTGLLSINYDIVYANKVYSCLVFSFYAHFKSSHTYLLTLFAINFVFFRLRIIIPSFILKR